MGGTTQELQCDCPGQPRLANRTVMLISCPNRTMKQSRYSEPPVIQLGCSHAKQTLSTVSVPQWDTLPPTTQQCSGTSQVHAPSFHCIHRRTSSICSIPVPYLSHVYTHTHLHMRAHMHAPTHKPTHTQYTLLAMVVQSKVAKHVSC